MARVEQFHNKNQFVIYEPSKATFQSYESTICILNNDSIETLRVGRRWDYSKTTLKHFYMFLEEYISYVWVKIKDSKNKRKAFQEILDSKDPRIVYDENLF